MKKIFFSKLLCIFFLLMQFFYINSQEISQGPFEQLIIRSVTLINGNGSPPIGPVDIEVKNNIFFRRHFGKAQRLGTRMQRLKILPTTFRVYNHSSIKGKPIALVDDVVTTGSTARAATDSLLKAGAKSVDLWCIAKTSWQN